MLCGPLRPPTSTDFVIGAELSRAGSPSVMYSAWLEDMINDGPTPGGKKYRRCGSAVDNSC